MYRIIHRLRAAWIARRQLSGVHRFIDRRRGCTDLIVLLVGCKPGLWGTTRERLRKYVPAHMDLCLVCTGRCSPELEQLSAERHWSLIETRTPCPNLGMNLAIDKHPAAKRIVKLDEAIVVAPGFFESLLIATHDSKANIRVVAPILTINGFSYRLILEEYGCLEDYQSRFGPARMACGGLAVTTGTDAARYIWNLVCPFDSAAERFSRRTPGFHFVPHRFSIGVIAFERSFWTDRGMFTIPLDKTQVLGSDEYQLCHFCYESGGLLAVSNRLLAGHYSFGPQMASLEPFREQLLTDIDGNTSPH